MIAMEPVGQSGVALKSRTGVEEQIPFQDREEALEKVQSVAPGTLLDIYGVTGIGKTRLLYEVRKRVTDEDRRATVLYVDLGELADLEAGGRPEVLVRSLFEQEPSLVREDWPDLGQVADELVKGMDAKARDAPVYLMLDTTERLQVDAEFWRWAEEHLLGPLLVREQVRVVAAGRIPAPWRRYEVRRTVELLSLDPLPQDDAAQALIREALKLRGVALDKTDEDRVVDVILSLSFGHPLLSEQLAEYAAQRPRDLLSDKDRLRGELSEEVDRFIKSYLLEGIDDERWREVLQWACVLDWFDPTLLRYYFKEMGHKLGDESDLFFLRAISHMRVQHALTWYGDKGHIVHGVLRDIMRTNLEIRDPGGFRNACQAAARVFEMMAEELSRSGDEEEARSYSEEAEEYRKRAEKVNGSTSGG